MNWDETNSLIIKMPSGFKYRAWLDPDYQYGNHPNEQEPISKISAKVRSCRHEDYHKDNRDIKEIDQEWASMEKIAAKIFDEMSWTLLSRFVEFTYIPNTKMGQHPPDLDPQSMEQPPVAFPSSNA